MPVRLRPHARRKSPNCFVRGSLVEQLFTGSRDVVSPLLLCRSSVCQLTYVPRGGVERQTASRCRARRELALLVLLRFRVLTQYLRMSTEPVQRVVMTCSSKVKSH
jgi:hypothetical protein